MLVHIRLGSCWSPPNPETEWPCLVGCPRLLVSICEGVSKSFRTDRLERELQMVQLSATSCSCISILWVCLVCFAVITLCVASRVFIVYLVMDSVRKRLDTPSYSELSSISGGCLLHPQCEVAPSRGDMGSSEHCFILLAVQKEAKSTKTLDVVYKWVGGYTWIISLQMCRRVNTGKWLTA
jgi:hypothetical protein